MKVLTSMHAPDLPLPNTPKQASVEWPTVAMVAVCYLGWALVLIFHAALGVVITVLILAVMIALHSSLQHEVLHDHPFRNKLMNEALVFPAVGLLIPYQRFRDLHLRHHFDPNLTDPYDDPESNYLDPGVWAETPLLMKAIYRFNNVLLGRMVVGPLLSVIALYRSDVVAMRQGDRAIALAYLWHVLGLVPVIWCIVQAGVPLLAYLAAAYMGMSLLKIRTFLEHRAHEKVPGRTVIIESRGPLALLFLNNNFHSVHHAHPCVPWYQLPGFYAARRAQFLERNQAYLYRSYVDVFRQYFLRTKDPVPHPLITASKPAHTKARELEYH